MHHRAKHRSSTLGLPVDKDHDLAQFDLVRGRVKFALLHLVLRIRVRLGLILALLVHVKVRVNLGQT